MIVSIIIVSSIFAAFVMTACVMINGESADSKNKGSDSPHENMCGEENEKN